MCLIALAWKVHPDFPLVLAANRDEFHDRPAAPAQWWDGGRSVYGGRDLSQGGGWLALSRSGRLAAVTNVRRMVPPDPRAPSRGKLVAEFVSGSLNSEEYAEQLEARANDYAGFNLLLHDGATLLYCSNVPLFRAEVITPGVHVLSNASLDTPWPKTLRLQRAMQAWVNQRVATRQLLFAALADAEWAADEELPDTGVGLQLERLLSPPFIRGDRYGTRASSVVTMHGDGHAEFAEKRFGKSGEFLDETRELIHLSDGRVH